MKKIVLGIMILVSLIAVACSPQATTTGGGAFIGGTEGVIASFEPFSVKEADTYTIFDTEDFSIDVVLKNKGEENLPVGKATVRLLGPPKESYENIVPANWELANSHEVEKISEFNPGGGEEIVSFTPSTPRAKFKGVVTGFQDVVWNVEYWYEYKTHLIVNDVCFKGDITDTKVCEVKEAKTFSVSGAPVTVTSVAEDTAGKGVVLLKIDVKNAGTGDTTTVGQEFDTRFDQIAYTVDEPEKWECKSGGRENEARLIDGTAQIICRLKQPLADDELYTKAVRLTFQYVYKDLIQEKLRIKESVR